jgi:dTDP-4-dehydrorhamnose 3,5-epimerase-like enzyme
MVIPFSGENCHIFYALRKLTHSFCILSTTVEVMYIVRNENSFDHQAGIILIWNAPNIVVPRLGAGTILAEPDAMSRCQRGAATMLVHHGGL